LLALWCEHFAGDVPFRAFVVEQGGQFVAALPLIEGRRLGLKVATLPQNLWSPGGDLLLDPGADCDRVCEMLLHALTRDAWPLVWLDALPGDESRWQIFLAALDRQGIAYARRQRFRINRVHVERDWQAYFDSRSRNHRRHIRKSIAHARRAGATELACYDALAPGEVEPLLRSCFEIEARSWKGRAKGAVLNVPGVWSFYLEQAKQLAASGQLSLVVLNHSGRPIAFEYGWRGKGVYFSPKVGYDEAFRSFSPGQLLRSFLLERAHRDGNLDWVDFLGPASTATSKWATHDYAIDRVVIALRGALGRGIVGAYRHGWPWLHRIRTMGRPGEGAPTPRPIDTAAAIDDRKLPSDVAAVG
jgi:CelD/BcsL family acetyltransferase involved in cellulose biosynthesis